MSAKMKSVILRFLEGDGWPSEVADQGIIKSRIQLDNCSCTVLIQPNEELETVTVYTYCPESVPEGLRSRVLEFIARANYGLRTACLEMDIRDGEVRSRSGVRIEPSALTEDLVKRLTYDSAICMDKYYPGITALLVSSRTAEELIRMIEGG